MRNKNNKHLGIEIDPELHYKLHYISKYYGRSANGEILYLIRQGNKGVWAERGRDRDPEGNQINPNIKTRLHKGRALLAEKL